MSRFGLEIRAAAPADAALLAELLQACGITAPATALAERIEAIRRAEGQVLLAWEWGPPSGAIAFSRLSILTSSAPVALASLFLVAPDARRRGVGRLLLKAASQAARQGGCDALRLVAPEDQHDLRAFCEATGFTAGGGVFERPLRKRA